MTEWTPFLAHAGLTIGLFAWLRNDINQLRRETNTRFKEVNERFDVARNEMDVRFDKARKEMDVRFDKAYKEMDVRFDKARRETDERFDKAHRETDERFKGISECFSAFSRDTNEHFAELRKDIQAVDVRLARIEATLETTFRLQGVLPTDRQEQVA